MANVKTHRERMQAVLVGKDAISERHAAMLLHAAGELDFAVKLVVEITADLRNISFDLARRLDFAAGGSGQYLEQVPAYGRQINDASSRLCTASIQLAMRRAALTELCDAFGLNLSAVEG